MRLLKTVIFGPIFISWETNHVRKKNRPAESAHGLCVEKAKPGTPVKEVCRSRRSDLTAFANSFRKSSANGPADAASNLHPDAEGRMRSVRYCILKSSQVLLTRRPGSIGY
jgi:hypothetical protein